MDILSFQKAIIQPDTPQDCLDYISDRIIAIPFINGRSHFDIIKPFLDKAAWLYMNRSNRYIYIFAEDLYRVLASVNDNKHSDGCVVELLFLKKVFDACAPTWVMIERTEDAVVWTAYAHYKCERFDFSELPVFRFDVGQYNEALVELRNISSVKE